jgi:hypothetical protein
MNEAVLQAVERYALTPGAVEQVIKLTERDDVEDRRASLLRERRDLEKRMTHLRNALELGGAVTTLVARLRELEGRLSDIDRDLGVLQPVPRLPPSVVEDRLGEWRRLLRQSTTQARAVLQRVLRGRLVFTPRADGNGYDFSGPTRFDKLFSGIAVERPSFIPRGARGTEHITPDDTLDSDYGRLLERICGTTENGWRPQRDSNPCFGLESEKEADPADQ